MSMAKKKARALFSKVVFERDGYKCVFCSITEELDAHHITDRNDMPNGGYVAENGITLCPDHHRRAESGYPTADELYSKIGTDYNQAFVASARSRFQKGE